ncbi:heavy-metal-associated domain-containing protein [Fusobacterium nucleatum]|uniref:heavy-metal-associated domain-containing protein n=1 Tax=Fusobacterium nucleatum TaxID=851 RepID=UPI0030CCF583
MKLNLKIDGMGCEHCVKSVREALETVKGIKILDVKIGSAEIEAENDSVLSEIKEKLDDVGYDLVR